MKSSVSKKVSVNSAKMKPKTAALKLEKKRQWQKQLTKWIQKKKISKDHILQQLRDTTKKTNCSETNWWNSCNGGYQITRPETKQSNRREDDNGKLQIILICCFGYLEGWNALLNHLSFIQTLQAFRKAHNYSNSSSAVISSWNICQSLINMSIKSWTMPFLAMLNCHSM